MVGALSVLMGQQLSYVFFHKVLVLACHVGGRQVLHHNGGVHMLLQWADT